MKLVSASVLTDLRLKFLIFSKRNTSRMGFNKPREDSYFMQKYHKMDIR